MSDRITKKSQIETLESNLRVQFSSFLNSKIGVWDEGEVSRTFRSWLFCEIAKLQARVEDLESNNERRKP